jgi:putative RecB family exonuclease
MNSQNHDHLSYSQINTYMTCSLRYKFQYIDAIPATFTSAALAFGSGIHEAVAAFYQTRLEGEELREDHMLDVYRNAWSKFANVKFFNGDNQESLAVKAKELISAFCASANPNTQILGVEEFFELPLGGLPIFQGYIDLIEQDANGRVTIVDMKTSAKKPSNSNVDDNLQLTAYSFGAEALGFNVYNMKFRLDVLTKTKSPELVKLETSRTDKDRDRFIRLVYSIWNGIQREVFYPKQDWHCSQCAWATYCADW